MMKVTMEAPFKGPTLKDWRDAFRMTGCRALLCAERKQDFASILRRISVAHG